MKLIEIKRKSRVLTRAQFGCLKDAYTINITKGCEFLCTYCYARGYRWAPPSGMVQVYANLPDKVASELDNPRKRTTMHAVFFNTASDSFQSHPRVLETTYRTMKVFLDRGVGFSFLTKGWIPERFVRLFSQSPGLVKARVGLVSMSQRYVALFEPHAASAQDRIENIKRLLGAGVSVEVRVDPIIPFYTDDARSIIALYEALAANGITDVRLNYLHLRPHILDQLTGELPPTQCKVLRSCFETQSWSLVGTSTRSKLIPLALRERGYRRFLETAEHFHITARICACKNPDMPAAQLCSSGVATGVRRTEGEERGQLSLFPC